MSQLLKQPSLQFSAEEWEAKWRPDLIELFPLMLHLVFWAHSPRPIRLMEPYDFFSMASPSLFQPCIRAVGLPPSLFLSDDSPCLLSIKRGSPTYKLSDVWRSLRVKHFENPTFAFLFSWWELRKKFVYTINRFKAWPLWIKQRLKHPSFLLAAEEWWQSRYSSD